MSFSAPNPAVCFIDLATFSEIEGFLYGGPDAVTWFVAAVQKSNWFSYIPIALRHNGTVGFGQKNVSASVNRSADYVLHVWFRCQLPYVGLFGAIRQDAAIRWTNNFMHNLFEKISISFNELVVQEFDNFWLDFNAALRIPAEKQFAYNTMIGNVAPMTTFVSAGATANLNSLLGTGGYFTLILPFWFGEDSGIALPVAALPFNDIKINYTLRNWRDLLILWPGAAGVGAPAAATFSNVYTASYNNAGVVVQGQQGVELVDPQTFAHYAVVHNDERVKMGDAPRDMLIHQIQTTQTQPFRDMSTSSSFDIRLSHAVVLFVYAAQNISLGQFAAGNLGYEWSNYESISLVAVTAGVGGGAAGTAPFVRSDPIIASQLIYENSTRLAMGSDYFSLVHPFLLSDATISNVWYGPGIHMWSYSLKPWDPLRPAGSTDYSKLANVSINHQPSNDAINASAAAPVGNLSQGGTGPIQYQNQAGTLTVMPQRYRHIFAARNHNIGRVANGSFGHPTL